MATSLADVFTAISKAGITSSGRRKTGPPPNKSTQSTTTPEGQLALYAAALADKDYVSADAIRTPMYFPSGTLANYQTMDPISNRATVQRSVDQYDTGGKHGGMFSAPVHWEATHDDRGNPITDEYYQGEPNRPTGWETQGGYAARVGPEGEPNAAKRFGGFHWGGMTPYSTAWDQFGNERPITDFPMPDVVSQFSPFEGTREKTGRYSPNTMTGFTMNPYSPYGDGGMSHDMFRVPRGGNSGLFEMGIPMTVAQLNAERAANAIAAKRNYNRAWAAGPSYGGGY